MSNTILWCSSRSEFSIKGWVFRVEGKMSPQREHPKEDKTISCLKFQSCWRKIRIVSLLLQNSKEIGLSRHKFMQPDSCRFPLRSFASFNILHARYGGLFPHSPVLFSNRNFPRNYIFLADKAKSRNEAKIT